MKIWPMFCKACGQGIDRGDKFCRNCGVPLPQEPIESAVAATASAAVTGEPPIAVPSSTAALQRPLPIPKALLTEVASAAAVEEKPAVAVTVPAVPDAAPAASNADKTSTNGQPREAAQPAAPQPKVEAAAAQTPIEPKSEAVAPPQPAEPKPQAAAPAQPAPEKQIHSAAKPEPTPQPSDIAAAKSSPAAVAVDPLSAVAEKPQPEQPAVSHQAKSIDTALATPQETARPNNGDHEAAGRPLRLCPQCHRIVGEDDVVCERCKARLDQPAAASAASEAAPPVVSEQQYGVPSFAGYAAEPPARKEAEKSSAGVALSDPSGVDAIANLRVRKRRGLSAVEMVVVVVLLAGAGMAVWMLRSGLPSKTSTPAVSVGITISPTRAKVVAGHGYDFAATVTGTDNYNVDWSIDEGDSGGRIVPRGAKAKSGAVSSLAVYMSPKTPGTYHLTATSQADSAKAASATITVTGK